MQKQGGHNTYVIMKKLCPPSHHQNDSVATQVLEHMIYVMHTDLLYCIRKPAERVLLYMFMYNICIIYIDMYVYICNHENNVPSRLSP